MRYIISPEARADLDDIWLHIAHDDPSAADGAIDYLTQSLGAIAAIPTIGRISEDFWPGAYCYKTGKGAWRSHFLIFYRIESESLEIARIIEGHRNITPDMFE